MAQVVFAQDFSLYGNGARAAGMGYAFTGIADDATAISWNPAGLTQLMTMEASLVGRFGFGSLSTKYSDINPTTEIGSSFNLNFASFVFPFKLGQNNAVAGIAYRRVYNNTEKMSIKFSDFDYEYTIDNKGGVDAISPSVGFQINDMISVGATLNILMGSTDFNDKESYPGYLSESKYSEDYSGTTVELGVLVKPSPQISLGADFKLPYTVKVDESWDGGSDSYNLEFPMFFDLGAGFRATDNLTLAADYRIHPVKDLKVDGEKLFGSDADVTGNSIHVGLEYFMQTGQNVMPLRVGYFTFPTSTFDINGDQVTYNGLSAGLGLIMGNFILDGAFEWLFKTYPGDTDYATGDDVNYTYNNFRITIGAVIHFGEK